MANGSYARFKPVRLIPKQDDSFGSTSLRVRNPAQSRDGIGVRVSSVSDARPKHGEGTDLIDKAIANGGELPENVQPVIHTTSPATAERPRATATPKP